MTEERDGKKKRKDDGDNRREQDRESKRDRREDSEEEEERSVKRKQSTSGGYKDRDRERHLGGLVARRTGTNIGTESETVKHPLSMTFGD